MNLFWRTLAVFLMSTQALAQAPASLSPRRPDPVAPIDYETARLERVVTAVRITEPITLDGYLNEPVWHLALPATDFIQWGPFPGQPSRERTEARFLYDENNLYVGIICFDSQADKMVVNDLKEDFNFQGTDNLGLVIDSLHDRRSGFLFRTNPVGARSDSQISNESFQDDWDGV